MAQISKISAKINGHFSFSNEELRDIDFSPIDDHHFHILHKNQSYRATLVQANYEEKSFLIKINGNKYTIQLSDQYDQLIEQLGLNILPTHTALDIKAPMPGLVLDILVEQGQEVEEGTPILILEAMKMENVLKAGAPGHIETIEVEKGAAVEKGQLLVKCKE